MTVIGRVRVENETSTAGPSGLALDSNKVVPGEHDQIERMPLTEWQEDIKTPLCERAENCSLTCSSFAGHSHSSQSTQSRGRNIRSHNQSRPKL